MPKVPVFILAAMAISSTLKANDLLEVHNQLMDGLLDAGICVSSYACDGSAMERKVARQFLESSVDQKTFLISHAKAGFLSFSVELYLYGPKSTPIVCIQDSKHALKTLRNILYSGTHGIVIGNCPVYYQQLLVLSKDPVAPYINVMFLKLTGRTIRLLFECFLLWLLSCSLLL